MKTNFAPIPDEIDVANLVVEGRLPEGLQGTLYRNGPNPYPGEPVNHWFLGAGMVHAIQFQPNGCHYRNRWVAPASGYNPESKANTHILMHANKLMALEEGHAPIAISPQELTPIGPAYDISPFTAHPKYDPNTKELVWFSYAADGPGSRSIRCGALNGDGDSTWETRFETPYSCMIHDMGLTQHYIVLPVLPLVLESDDKQGFDYRWRPEFGGKLAVLARGDDGNNVRWYQAPPGFAFHIVNAWEEGSHLFLDLFLYDAPPLFPNGDGTQNDSTQARLCRWQLELKHEDTVHATMLDHPGGEFPRIDERLTTRRHNKVYYVTADNSRAVGFHTLIAADVNKNISQRYDFGFDASVSEPIFVPRQYDSPADEGYLMSTVWRPDWINSRVAILNAASVEKGPCAWVHMPQRIPNGFHGSFIADTSLTMNYTNEPV